MLEEPKIVTWEELSNINGYYIDTGSLIIYTGNSDPTHCNRNIFSTALLARMSLSIAKISQTYKTYVNSVDFVVSGDDLPFIEITKGYKLTFIKQEHLDLFIEKNTEDLKLILGDL